MGDSPSSAAAKCDCNRRAMKGRALLTIHSQCLSSSFAFYCARTNVTPTKAPGPVDTIDGGVSANPRFADAASGRRNRQDASAVGKDFVAFLAGPCVQEQNARHTLGVFDTSNLRHAKRFARI